MSALVRIAWWEPGFGDAQAPMPSAQRPADEHLRACVDVAADRGEWEHADVLYFRRAVSAEQVLAQLDVFPGCAVCAGASADGRVTFAARLHDGRRPIVGSLGHGAENSAQISSIIHALMTWGVRLG